MTSSQLHSYSYSQLLISMTFSRSLSLLPNSTTYNCKQCNDHKNRQLSLFSSFACTPPALQHNYAKAENRNRVTACAKPHAPSLRVVVGNILIRFEKKLLEDVSSLTIARQLFASLIPPAFCLGLIMIERVTPALIFLHVCI